LISASIFAAAAWWLGLLMTKHPLLAQIGMATDGMAVDVPWLPLVSGIRARQKSRSSGNARACAKLN
jgi:hypothetical protein